MDRWIDRGESLPMLSDKRNEDRQVSRGFRAFFGGIIILFGILSF